MSKHQPTVCIISLTYVTQEPRVIRQLRTFEQRGWSLVVIGYPGQLPVPGNWCFYDASERSPIADVPESRNENSFSISFRRALKNFFGRLCWYFRRNTCSPAESTRKDNCRKPTPLNFIPPSKKPSASEVSEAFANAITRFWNEPKMQFLAADVLPKVPRCDLVIAHDYFTMPLAAWISTRDGIDFVVDNHEYAIEQYAFQPGSSAELQWLTETRPFIDALQNHFFSKAKAMTAVCDGIAQALADDYKLSTRPTTVRSTPFYITMPFNRTGERISVLYHGIVNHTRHLEVAVESLAQWRPEFELTIRGPGPEEYFEKLALIAQKFGVSDRLRLEPPVPFSELVPSANKSDVGYLAFSNFSRQRLFASPNKFFEYIMAGLALIVMDVPELKKIAQPAQNATFVRDFDPDSIAAAVNSLSREQIDDMKMRSLSLARELCWEREQQTMIQAYDLPHIEDQLRRG